MREGDTAEFHASSHAVWSYVFVDAVCFVYVSSLFLYFLDARQVPTSLGPRGADYASGYTSGRYHYRFGQFSNGPIGRSSVYGSRESRVRGGIGRGQDFR